MFRKTMDSQLDNARINADLMIHRAVMVVMAAGLAVAVAVCIREGEQWQQHWPQDRLITYRTLFYGLAIITFPLTNLIRYIQVRLCQTMPGDRSAKRRYLTAVIVSMVLVETIGILGIILFLLGDGLNTLYIFTGLAALGFVLYRPKPSEYAGIVAALAHRSDAPTPKKKGG
jgi:F0F1-type ATP synthase membrane subunit c/vacuolar-type H+-ATPase subunit K